MFVVTRRGVSPLRQTVLTQAWPGCGYTGRGNQAATLGWSSPRPPASVITMLIISPDRHRAQTGTNGDNIISQVKSGDIRRPRDATPLKGGPCPRAVTGDPGLTTGQCQCHSPQTPSLDPVWCLSPVCSHRGLVTSWLSLISGQLWRMARCNNVLMRCQHGVNYVVCKQ